MSTIKVNTIQNTSGVEVYTAKAWVNFNGTGTVAIRASGNVSSITDNGTGSYTVNFATAMPDADYAVSGAVQREATTGGGIHVPVTFSTSNYSFLVRDVSNGLKDGAYNSIAIFR